MSKQNPRSRRRIPVAIAAVCAAAGSLAIAPGALALAPVNVVEPSISGTPQQGQTLTADDGEWVEDPLTLPVNYTYQWLRCNALCDPIGGATDATYLLAAADVGATIRVRVTATDSTPESTEAESDATMPIAAPPPPDAAPQITALPALSGTARVGQTLSRTDATVTGNPEPTVVHRWQRCAGLTCSNIGSETGDTYELSTADAGRVIRVLTTAQNRAGTAQQPTGGVGPVQETPSNSELPEVAGSTVEGDTLFAIRGSWRGYPTPTYAYQWQRCNEISCSNIAAATAGAYTLTAADIGSTIRVRVTATNSAGSDSADSAQTDTVTRRPPQPAQPPRNLAPPNISGIAELGQTLTGGDGVWQGTAPIAFTRRWLRCSAAGCGAIPGATGRTYVIGGSDVGYSVRFQVSGDNSASAQPVVATSAPTATVVQNIGPTAAFRVSPARPVVGDTVDFTSISSDADGPIASHAWDLDGDGGYTDDNARGQIAARKFTKTGRYTVRLLVTDTDGATDVETVSVTVGLPPLLSRPYVSFKGSFRRRYTTIKRLAVKSRRGAMVKSACVGRDCPKKASVSLRSKGKSIRFKRYERRFRPGSKIAFRVTYPKRVGRYTSITIRKTGPVRVNRCLDSRQQ